MGPSQDPVVGDLDQREVSMYLVRVRGQKLCMVVNGNARVMVPLLWGPKFQFLQQGKAGK